MVIQSNAVTNSLGISIRKAKRQRQSYSSSHTVLPMDINPNVITKAFSNASHWLFIKAENVGHIPNLARVIIVQVFPGVFVDFV
jgi:hypothetical protein